MFKIKKNKIKEECWNLDYELIKWLNDHLKVFKEDSMKIVDLEDMEYKYSGKIVTELELIDKLISITDELLDEYSKSEFSQRSRILVDDMYEILRICHFGLWW